MLELVAAMLGIVGTIVANAFMFLAGISRQGWFGHLIAGFMAPAG